MWAFVTGTDGVLYMNSVPPDGQWSAWRSGGTGVLTSAPAVVSWDKLHRFDIFARGTDGGLWHKFAALDGFHGWNPLGGALVGDPAVSSWSAGRLDVFVRGTDDQLWHRFFVGNPAGAGSWSSWEPLGGELASGPAAVSWAPNRIDVFAEGTDAAVWHKTWAANTWGSWESWGGRTQKAPAVASTQAGDLEVYAVGAGSPANLLHRSYLSYARGLRDWRAEGPFWNGSWTFAPGVVAHPYAMNVDTFGVGSDGSIVHSSTWSAMPPGFARPRSR